MAARHLVIRLLMPSGDSGRLPRFLDRFSVDWLCKLDQLRNRETGKMAKVTDRVALRVNMIESRDIKHYQLDPRNPDRHDYPDGVTVISTQTQQKIETEWSDGITTVEYRTVDQDGNVLSNHTAVTRISLHPK